MQTAKQVKVKPTKPTKSFIVGIIYDYNSEKNNRVISAVAVYDRENKKGTIQSINKIIQQLKAGEKIAGIELKQDCKFIQGEKMEYKTIEKPAFDMIKYKYQRLPVLNGKGEVIKSGKDVVVGRLDVDRYITVNSEFKEKCMLKNDILNKQLVGVTNNGIAYESSELLIDRLSNITCLADIAEAEEAESYEF